MSPQDYTELVGGYLIWITGNVQLQQSMKIIEINACSSLH